MPATLASIPLNCRTGSPSLSAYPCWSLQEEGNCASIQSAVDVFMDPQEVIWALDTGIVNTLEEPVRKCPPKVVAINAKDGNVSIIILKKLRRQILIIFFFLTNS